MANKRKEIIKIGLPWAIGMYVIMTFVFPYFNREPITLKKSLIALPFWLLGGFLFGWAMNRWLPKEK